MLSSVNKKNVAELFNSISTNEEFEVMFNNYRPDNVLSLIDFMNVMKYVRYRAEVDKLPLKESISLDVFYGEYRFTINTLENINNVLGLLYQRKNNNLFSILVSQYLDKDGFHLIQKIKEKSNIIDVDNMNIRFRKSKEYEVGDKDVIMKLSKLPSEDAGKILYRYKQRMSLEIQKDIYIDLTIIRTSDNPSTIMGATKSYEIEIDYSPKNKLDSKMFELILNETETIKKVMIGSNIIIDIKEEREILENYKQLVYGNSGEQATILYTMQPISAEVQHIIDIIPNKYSATDKADGEKYQLFVHKGEAYLISNNLHVKKIGMKAKLKDTIVEGELVYLEEKKVYTYMMFDCLYYDGEDYRGKAVLKERLEPLSAISNAFNNKPFIIKDYEGAFDLMSIKKHYVEMIRKYYDELNNSIEKMKQNDILVYPKMFMYPNGGSASEVFLFSDIIWNNCTKNTNVACPYVLDGVIFTPLEQKYTRDRKEQRLAVYKYKPPSTNSVDVYITFEKNKDTGGYMDIFDNSLPDKIENKVFRVVNLFVGEMIGGKEQPVPFMKENQNHIIYMPLVNGQVRDIEGNIVNDKTVVEMIYNNDTTMPHQYRWNITRTRWDKTESVLRYNKRYGNNREVAEKVWKSMIESVTIEEVANLSNPKTYDMQMKLLSSRLDSSVIVSQRKQDVYYQKITNLIKKMREFHNWVKSIIIYTYCSPMPNKVGGKVLKQSVLDIGCGRGGDILKMYHARVGDYVGIDPDFEGIYSATDGAISRYNYLKSKFPDFGKVTYIQADGGIMFDSGSQLKALPNLSKENISALDRVFTKDRKFDTFSSQMAIHYLFKDSTTISNMITNIKNYLKKDGYILLTLFDPARIHKNFDENGHITSYYTDDEGKRNVLFDIVKKYDGDITNKVGQPIDVHMSWISEEGKYIEEYLVTKELMVDTMAKAGCRLVDTDLFANIFNINRPYFENVIKYEENPKNKQFYEKVAEFFGDLKGADKESRNWSFMFRYYVFQKS